MTPLNLDRPEKGKVLKCKCPELSITSKIQLYISFIIRNTARLITDSGLSVPPY
jgi:hypothetical protein